MIINMGMEYTSGRTDVATMDNGRRVFSMDLVHLQRNKKSPILARGKMDNQPTRMFYFLCVDHEHKKQ